MPAALEKMRHCPRLPGDILLQIFSKLNFETRREVVPLVCKHWKALVEGPSQVWQRICFAANMNGEFHQIMRWLARHGDAVLEMDASLSDWGYQDPDEQCPRTSWLHYQHGVKLIPALLPNLQHLKLDCEYSFMVVEEDLFSLRILTSLQTLRLTVASNGEWDLNTLGPLQHLTALKKLDMRIKHFGSGPMLLAPDLSKLILLTSLHLEPYSLECCSYNSKNAGNVIGSLTSLQNLSLTNIVDKIPRAFSSLQDLRTLDICGHGHEEWPHFSVQPSFSSCRKLTQLQLQSFAAVAGAKWLNAWSALSGLPSLSDIILDCVDLEDLEPHKWAFGNSLTSLTISASHLKTFPRALVSLTSIRELALDMTTLHDPSDLPDGPYLNHLESLDLCETTLTVFPEALSHACKLKTFKIFDDEPWLDVDRLKAILPQCCMLILIEVKAEIEASDRLEDGA